MSSPLPHYPAPLRADRPPSAVTTPRGTLRVTSFLGRGKSAYSWEATLAGCPVTLKIMHAEPCAYYSFPDRKTLLEERDYHRLREAGIAMPALLHVDHDRGFLVKEFIDGMTADRVIAEGLPASGIITQLFEMASRSRAAGLNIDWFPTNFVIRDARLYYVDYEANPFDDRWSLERWGLYYWANTAGMGALRAGGSTSLLHTEPDSGIPIKAPFEAVVRFWREEFGAEKHTQQKVSA